MKKLNLKKGLLMVFGVSTLTNYSFSQMAGDVDETWSNNGWSINNHVISKPEYSSEMKMLADGGFLLVGSTGEPNRDILLAKYSSNGYLNPNFGSGGVVTIDVDELTNRGYDASVLSDGKILVVGSSGADLVLVRLESDGSFDFSFGTNGIIKYEYANGPIIPNKIEVLADNAILISVFTFNGTVFEAGILKFTQHGALSASFGQSGLALVNDPDNAYVPLSMKVLDNGAILICGYKLLSDRGNGFIAKFSSAGNIDNSFGPTNNGLSNEVGTINLITQFEDLEVDNEGRIIVIASDDNMDGAIYRYLANGLIDNTYTANGKITFGPDVNLHKIVKTADNDFLVIGEGTGTEFNQVFTFMFNNNGEANCNYHCNGVFTSLPYDVTSVNANLLGLMPNGSIVVGGDFLGPDFALSHFFVGKLLNTNQVVNINENELSKATLTVYPNPVTSSFKIQIQEGEQIEKVTLISMEGRIVQEWMDEMSTYVLDNSQPSGMYFLNVQTVQNNYRNSIIIK